MIGMKTLMFAVLSVFAGVSGDDIVASVGSQRDDNNCVTDGGYQWCEETKSCGRPWIEPCPDRPDPVSDALSEPPQCAEVMCMIYCKNGRVMDDSGCPRCLCKVVEEHPSCDIPYTDCGMKSVCPRVKEITSCGLGGLEGYTTYRLSLVIKDPRIKGIYIMYGSKKNVMYIPPAYQVDHLGSNIGGTDLIHQSMNPRLKYDSWISLGHVDGSPSLVRAIGLDFTKWGSNSPLKTNNGAIFSMDPLKVVVSGREIVVAQLTIPNDVIDKVIINVEGNYKREFGIPVWVQDDIEFSLKTPSQIPRKCVSWNDGCNTCVVKDGVMGGCTRRMCFVKGNSHCEKYDSGH